MPADQGRVVTVSAPAAVEVDTRPAWEICPRWVDARVERRLAARDRRLIVRPESMGRRDTDRDDAPGGPC